MGDGGLYFLFLGFGFLFLQQAGDVDVFGLLHFRHQGVPVAEGVVVFIMLGVDGEFVVYGPEGAAEGGVVQDVGIDVRVMVLRVEHIVQDVIAELGVGEILIAVRHGGQARILPVAGLHEAVVGPPAVGGELVHQAVDPVLDGGHAGIAVDIGVKAEGLQAVRDGADHLAGGEDVREGDLDVLPVPGVDPFAGGQVFPLDAAVHESGVSVAVVVALLMHGGMQAVHSVPDRFRAAEPDEQIVFVAVPDDVRAVGVDVVQQREDVVPCQRGIRQDRRVADPGDVFMAVGVLPGIGVGGRGYLEIRDAVKGAVRNGRDRGREVDARQAGVGEGLFPDGLHALRNGHLRQGGVAVKGIVFDRPQAGGQREVPGERAGAECQGEYQCQKQYRKGLFHSALPRFGRVLPAPGPGDGLFDL